MNRIPSAQHLVNKNNFAVNEHKSDEHISYLDIFRYFFPLALQAISQSFTYPLVAIVAAQGKEGAINIAAMAQANIVLFFLSSFGAGLLTSGMVYCINADGLKKFRTLNRSTAILITLLHAILCLPPVAKIILSSIMGLNEELYEPTYLALVLSMPFHFLFNLRNVPMVVLFNEKNTGKAFSATLVRICATVALAFLFAFVGLVGVFWAVICQIIPIILEVIMMKFFANPFEKIIQQIEGKSPSIYDMALLTGSFSIGKILISFSTYAVAGFAARATAPEIMLPAYYAAAGLMNPFAFAASRMQAAVITFAKRGAKNAKLFNFAILSGIVCGGIPLIFTLPGIIEAYYNQLQRIPIENLIYIRQSALVLLFVPFAISLRAYVEGLAALSRNSVAVIAGQGVYLGAVVSSAFFALNLGIQGNLIGAIALFSGNICAAAILALSLKISDENQKIEPPDSLIITQQ